VKVQIKSRWDASVLFEAEVSDDVEEGFRVRAALEIAVKARANLAGANLADANLARANLAGANLADANLADANLAGANLADANLARAYLARANLARANLARAYLARANLARANLARANLARANLTRANLADANLAIKPAEKEQAVKNLDTVAEIILENEERLQMNHWHGGTEWRDRTCAEEAVCGTTHCLAGWLQVCSTDPEIRKLDTQLAGTLLAPQAAKMFFREAPEVLDWLRNREYAK
jgi:hypothetical protein